jgi:hypothetical protein
MPIRPENKHYYKTDEWKAAKVFVKLRSKGKCEECNVPNGEVGIRERDGNWVNADEFSSRCSELDVKDTARFMKIVLTVAHLDQNPANNDLSNLKHLCQRCHNRLDAPHRAARRKNRGQETLL